MSINDVSQAEQRYFAAVARDYDRLQPVIAGPGYEAGLAMLVDLVPFGGGDVFRFVDLGAGTGTLTEQLLHRFRSARGVCLDGEPAMLELARAKLAPFAGRVEVQQADLLACQIPSCDLVVCSLVFHHVPPERLVETLRRIARALRPGGCLLLMDQMTAGPSWGARIGAQRRRLHDRHVAGWISVGRATSQEIDARWDLKHRMKQQGLDVEYRHSAEDLLDAMSGAGFAETGLVWRQFAMTILMGFVP
jgi:SAM-dependent methyltransferase